MAAEKGYLLISNFSPLNFLKLFLETGIPHDGKSRKFELFELVQLHKPPEDEKNYVIDNIIKSCNHSPLRTPPYMCELNPIELAWAHVKHFIRSHNTTGEFNIKYLWEMAERGIASVEPTHWKNFCRHVVDIENRFWETDQHMEEIEPIIISLDGNDSDDEDYYESDSSPDNKSDVENEGPD